MQRFKISKLLRDVDQEMNGKEMIYLNIGSKASERKVCGRQVLDGSADVDNVSIEVRVLHV
jgi:hypothetical protein